MLKSKWVRLGAVALLGLSLPALAVARTHRAFKLAAKPQAKVSHTVTAKPQHKLVAKHHVAAKAKHAKLHSRGASHTRLTKSTATSHKLLTHRAGKRK